MKNLLYFILILPVIMVAQAPTQTANYIMHHVYKEPSATTDTNKATSSVTYYDGLGRPIQTIQGKASASGNNVYTHIEYNGYGQQIKEYLPYTTGSSGLGFDTAALTNTQNFYTSTPGYEPTSNPYSQTFLDNSPLNRVTKKAAPGNAWVANMYNDNDHTIKFSYEVNADNEVKRLSAFANWNSSTKIYDIAFSDNGYYGSGQLYKNITKDENWTGGFNNTTEEFINKEGKVILKRTYNNGEKNDTYYVYDQFGNLTYVLPPLADGQLMDEICYHYKYDYRNRLAEKKLPGKKWEYLVYQIFNGIAFSGPALSPFGTGEEGWLFTIYDLNNRPCVTGWVPEAAINSMSRNTLQESPVLSVTAHRGNSEVDGITIGYMLRNSLPTGFKLLSVTYYDYYGFPGGPAQPTDNTVVEGQPVLKATKGLAVGGWNRVLTYSTETMGEHYYSFFDHKGRVISTKTTNYLGGFTQVDTKVDFDGTPEFSVTTHKRTASDSPITVKDNYTYTQQDRLLHHTHQINDLPVQQMAYNTYYELGELKFKYVGGVSPGPALQKIDYSYNIRGWLTGINNVDNLNADNDGDLFAFKINYNNPITERVGNQVKELYNGNIAETYWRSSSDNIKRKYGYKYDNLNRLENAWYQKPDNTVQVTNSYNESLTYDKNGNIKSLLRTGEYDDDVYTLEIDNLTYSYDTTKKNQLIKVVDATNHPAGFIDSPDNDSDDYTYDGYGNMTADRNKGITSIKYNYLNLPVEIIFSITGRKITYTYNAAGVKVTKVVYTPEVSFGGTVIFPASVEYTDYFEGFQYWNSYLQLFPTAEGYVDNTIVAGSNTYSYVFQYKDHLGNIRMNYALHPELQSSAGAILSIKEESHYYPFGLKHNNYGKYTQFTLNKKQFKPLS